MKTFVKLVGVGAAVTALTMQFATPVNAALGVSFTNSAVDRIQGAGSDTAFPLMNDLAQAYMESDGCLLTPVGTSTFPLVPASLQQNVCISGPAVAPQAGDNIYENYDHDVVVNFFPQGSNAGLGQLCNQRSASDGSGGNRDARVPYLDFARSSALPPPGFECKNGDVLPGTGGELGTSLNFVAYARDAISFTHWNTTGQDGAFVDDLTIAQLRSVFITCVDPITLAPVDTWDDLPGGIGTDPINVYSVISGSGTRSAWEGFLGGGNSTNCITNPLHKDGSFAAPGERVLREHQMEPIEQALNDVAAADEGQSISYMSVGLHNVNPGLAANSLIGDINGVSPTDANIKSGAFIASRDIYNVYRTGSNAPIASAALRRFLGMVGAPTPANVQAVGWICKGDAYHSEQVGNPSPEGIETATASQDWAEVKKQVFIDNGLLQLDPINYGAGVFHRCKLPIVVPVT